MNPQHIFIQGIPALIWGEPSQQVWLCVHGKMSNKESAEGIAKIAAGKGCQVICFDLPQHGERADEPDRCDIWNGIRDLTAVADFVFSRWQEVSLYACSLGAFFSLHAFHLYPFKKALFQSPIVDMEYLIGKMMRWFGVSEAQLKREQEIDTPIDTLSWKYFQYVKAHPITQWPIPTHILFAGQDDLQSHHVMAEFAQRFGCGLRISESSRHPFMEESDLPIVENWLHMYI